MLSIVFDMDGVLFDTQKIYTKTWLEVAKVLEIPDIDEPAKRCIGTNRNDQHIIINDFYQGRYEFPFEEFYRLKDEYFNRYLEEEVPLKPGTREILEYLKAQNAAVALASSSRVPVIMDHLKRTGLEGYFKYIIGGNMVLHSKPSPDIYLKACEVMGQDPKCTYAVEDSYNGIKAAVAAGMKTVMIPDVLPPTKEMDDIIYKRFDSLITFRDYLGKAETNE